jgi:uncharacterized membrane protein YhaH (DUF805 family)
MNPTAPPPPLLNDADGSPWRLLLDPRGRVGRRTWWWWGVIAPLGVSLLLQALLTIAGVAPDDAGLAVQALLVWPALAVSAKRWHDRGWSGWWVLAWLVPVLGWAFALVVNGLLRGTPGPNRFGAVPGSAGADGFGLPVIVSR